jgi:hypothetical protein
VRIAKGELHKTKEAALDVILEPEKLESWKSFTLYEMDEVDLILDNTFFEAYNIEMS